ncbi:MAG: type II toxin-antitoxin system Phd/YefM family antitoxin [Chloroflexia bacterium]|nr:type II toxin-antitoxin system Phd/YefM family antitoxin [Chloroflexia bacterium]
MRERQPATQTMKASEVRQQFSSVINRVAREETRVFVEKSGVPVAAIVSAKDLRRLEKIDADIAEGWRVLEAMRAPFRDVPTEEIEREAARAIAESRAERKAARKQAAGVQ